VRQPVISMAVSAVRALIDEINGHAAPHSEYLFRPELVVRGSTAPATADSTSGDHELKFMSTPVPAT
jgi:alanine racemase